VPKTLDELTARNVKAVMRIEAMAHAGRSRSECVADRITGFCGSMTFVWTHVAFFALWIAVNAVGAWPHLDPYPFEFLTLVVSLEAIFLSTFILISQNRQARVADRRNLLDLQIDLLAEQESTTTLRLLQRIACKVGVEIDDAEVEALESRTDPDRLADQIARTMERAERTDPVAACDAEVVVVPDDVGDAPPGSRRAS
jgi:uncharacterized membrane protein